MIGVSRNISKTRERKKRVVFKKTIETKSEK